MSDERQTPVVRGFRVRTITAGAALTHLDDPTPIHAALDALERVRAQVAGDGYEVQTIRVATPPVLAQVPPDARALALGSIQSLDRLVVERGALLSLGPAAIADADDASLAPWIADVIESTSATFTSIRVASEPGGVHRRSARAAAEVVSTLARSTSEGSGNFRFAAAASIPAGTPFFPVAWHEGVESLALGLETASLVHEAFTSAADVEHARGRLEAGLESALVPLDRLMREAARREAHVWLGIDTSPAPLQVVSIGRAIEALTGAPFGAPGTLDACALVTSVLRAVPVPVCGYCGLMLPVLEDQVLALRVTEGRFDLRDLLLYSTVCGTGLDMVPLPGDSSLAALAGIITDVAALSARLRKPLSARLYPVRGKAAGELAHFDDPYLTDAAVMSPDH